MFKLLLRLKSRVIKIQGRRGRDGREIFRDGGWFFGGIGGAEYFSSGKGKKSTLVTHSSENLKSTRYMSAHTLSGLVS